MKEALKSVMENEYEALMEMLKVLEEQYELLVKKDAFALDNIVKNIEDISKKVALSEIERRKITGKEKMATVVSKLNDKSVMDIYVKIKDTINDIKIQKESNELLIKQGLVFTTQMLNLINPNRNVKTYNSYGRTK